MSDTAAAGLPVSRVADLAVADPTRRWLVDGLWSQAAVGIIGGPPKAAKSWMALDMAISVASDTPCLGVFDVLEPGRALLFMAEDADAAVRARVAGICCHRGLDIHRLDLHIITATSLRLDLERDRKRLSDVVTDLAPRLLLLDPFVRLHRGDENDAGHISGLLAYLRELQRQHHLAVVVVHHTRKNAGGAALGQTLRGSGDFHAWIDSSLYLRRKRDSLTLSIEHRSAPAPDPLRLTLAGDDATGDVHLEISDDHHGGAAPDRDLAADVLDALVVRPPNSHRPPRSAPRSQRAPRHSPPTAPPTRTGPARCRRLDRRSRSRCLGEVGTERLCLQSLATLRGPPSGPRAREHVAALNASREHTVAAATTRRAGPQAPRPVRDDSTSTTRAGTRGGSRGSLWGCAAFTRLEEIAVGDFHTCGLRADGTALCFLTFTSVDDGQATPPAGVFTRLSAGYQHTCGIRPDQTVECWGKDDYGETVPPPGVRFSNINATAFRTCGIRQTDGQVQCWGFPDPAPPPGVFAMVDGYCGVGVDATIDCWGEDGSWGITTPPSGAFVSVSTDHFARQRACAVREDGSLACWGRVETSFADLYDEVDVAGAFVCARRRDGTLEAFGQDGHQYPALGRFVQVGAGLQGTCALTTENQLRCWGNTAIGMHEADLPVPVETAYDPR